jgi:SPP1 family predicted phage head-tail adaptor
MQAGKLDRLISIQEPVETNVGGELTLTYGTAVQVWAHVISQKGNEAFEAARINAKDNIRVCIRYRTITDKWRITWEGQNYNIVNIDRSEKRKGNLWMTCQCVGAA